ncbi:MAG: DNA recombination protein RmuC [Galbitalea sp.]
MVVRLPGGMSIAVDAKVPYNSYLEAARSPATATGDEEARRKSLLAGHAKQVRGHIDALSAKTYWAGLEASPEFTVAFIPSEPCWRPRSRSTRPCSSTPSARRSPSPPPSTSGPC